MKSPAFAYASVSEPLHPTPRFTWHTGKSSQGLRVEVEDLGAAYLTPYSNSPLPHVSQNSRCKMTPEPLSASWTLTWESPEVILKDGFGIFDVMPKGPPVNFYGGVSAGERGRAKVTERERSLLQETQRARDL